MRDSSIAKMARPWDRAGCHLISLLLGGLILVPPAAATDIPFYVSSNASEEVCFYCEGPWFRESYAALVPPGTVGLNFYTAEIDIFSPFGYWWCYVQNPPRVDPYECDGTSINRTVEFCLVAFPADAVDLTVEADFSITVKPERFVQQYGGSGVLGGCYAGRAAGPCGFAGTAAGPCRRAARAVGP